MANTASAQSVNLAWDANPEPEVSGYIVYAGVQPGVYDRQFDTGGTATSYVVPDVPAGQRFCFAVTAYTEARVESSKSAEVCGYSDAPPVLTNPGTQRDTIGQPVELQLQASDPQGQPLTFAATGLPAGLTLTGTTGFIQGTPTTAGTYQVTATASDGALSDSETFTWTVQSGNAAPVLVNPGSQRHRVGQAATLQLQATDQQGQALTYGAAGLPAGLSVASSTGRITGSATTAGTYQVTATVSDGSLSDAESFTWTIDAANSAPVLTNPGAQRHTVGQNVTLQLQASDAQGQALTYGASGLPAGLALAASTGRVTGSPTTVGTYQVTVTVSDGSLSDSESFVWTIEAANAAPVLVNPGTQRHQIGQSVTLQLQASDAQGQTLTYGASGLPAGLTVAASTGRITGRPTTAGTYQVTVSASDGSLTDSESFTWTIENSAPVLTNPGSQRHVVGQSVALQLQATDAQGQALVYSAAGLPMGLSVGSGSGSITGTPTAGGTYQVTITVSDGSLSDSESFTWTIDVPDTTAPTVSITQPTSSGTHSTRASSVTVSGTASDNVAVTSVRWQNDRGGQGVASGTTSWSTAVSLQWGWNVITVTARDSAGNTTASVVRVNRTLVALP